MNANKILDKEGKFRGILGLGGTGTDDIGNILADMEFLAVTDNQHTLSFPYLDSRDLILAHETGHALSLPHFNETWRNLMYPTFHPGTLSQDQLTRNDAYLDDESTQVGQARAEAIRFIGASTSEHIDTPMIGDAVWAVVGDLPQTEAFVDLAKVAVRQEPDAGTTIFYALTSGPLPDEVGKALYWFLLDVDNDPATGAPASSTSAEMGVTTTFEGADYLLQVQVQTTVSVGPQASAAVKRYESGNFTVEDDQSIQAIVGRLTPDYWLQDGYPDPGPIGMPQAVAGLQLNSALLGPLGSLRMAGAAQDAHTGIADFTQAKQLSFVLPPLPRCLVTPGTAQPGDMVIVTAHNLVPYATGSVFLGSDPLVLVSIDSRGSVVIPFTVPADVSGGNQQVSVVVNGTAVAAECSLFVTHPPAFDVPPNPKPGTEFTVYEGQPLTFDVQASDPESEDTVTLDVIAAPEGASFTSTEGNPATGIFSWTPTTGQDGIYVIPLTATDNHGAAAGALSVVVNVLVNEPPVASAGGPYTVPENGSTVLIGSGSDPDGHALTYAWDLNNDGTFETAGQNVTFSAVGRDGPGSQTVALQVCDDKAACADSSARVTITNVAPAVSNDRPAQSVQYGDAIAMVAVSTTDVNGDLPLSVSSSWTKDGGAVQTGLPLGFILTAGACTPGNGSTTCIWTLWARHTLVVPAEYIVTVSASDDDGGTGSTNIAITVEPEGPARIFLPLIQSGA